MPTRRVPPVVAAAGFIVSCSRIVDGGPAATDRPEARDEATPSLPIADASDVPVRPSIDVPTLDAIVALDRSAPTVDVPATDRGDAVDVPATDRGAPLDVLTADRTAPDATPDGCLICGGEAGTRCVDPSTDHSHCGGCNRWCSEWDDCIDGRCQTRCPVGRTGCGGGACADLQTDRANCGTCGNRCCAGSVCAGGRCVLSCAAGNSACCTSDRPDGCGCTCRDLQTDQANCGICGAACAPGQVCQAGRCASAGCGTLSCSAGLCVCEGRCTDFQTDTFHCGRCGQRCAAGEYCLRGRCEAPPHDGSAPTPDA